MIGAVLLMSGLQDQTAWADVEINEMNFPDPEFRELLISEYITVSGNDVLTDEMINSIKEIDVKSCEIKSLEGIEYFTALKSLDSSDNKLSSLNVEHNTALVKLYCNFTLLNNLDSSELKFYDY